VNEAELDKMFFQQQDNRKKNKAGKPTLTKAEKRQLKFAAKNG